MSDKKQQVMFLLHGTFMVLLRLFVMILLTLDSIHIIANYTLPSTDSGWFDEIIYADLNGEEAKKKVQEFNEKGKKALKERERDNDRNDRRRGKFHISMI